MNRLQRVVHENGVVTYQSPRLRATGVAHAFSTRLGGVSTGPYASLNLGSLEKDEHTDPNMLVARNFCRLREAIGVERVARVAVQQVHGSEVWVPSQNLVRPADAPCADAMVTDQTGQLLTIRTADCVPVLLASADGRVVAAVHAGWRGIVAGVVQRTIQVLNERFGVAAAELVAAVGPHIRVDHFEVGPEVSAAFDEADLTAAVVRDNGAKPHIDLEAAVLMQLERLGVARSQVDTTDRCTYRDAEEFYSYRRDGQTSGRMAAVIARHF